MKKTFRLISVKRFVTLLAALTVSLSAVSCGSSSSKSSEIVEDAAASSSSSDENSTAVTAAPTTSAASETTTTTITTADSSMTSSDTETTTAGTTTKKTEPTEQKTEKKTEKTTSATTASKKTETTSKSRTTTTTEKRSEDVGYMQLDSFADVGYDYAPPKQYIGYGRDVYFSTIGYAGVKIYAAPRNDIDYSFVLPIGTYAVEFTELTYKSGPGAWYFITYGGRYGWVNSYDVALTDDTPDYPKFDSLFQPELMYFGSLTNYYLVAEECYLRTGPKSDAETVTSMKCRDVMTLLGTDSSETWGFIETRVNNRQYLGWVYIGALDYSSDFATYDDFGEMYYQRYGEYPDFKLLDDTVTATGKPVIYLYPEKKTDISVKLELVGREPLTTYPKYNNGWNVTAYPDGSLVNKEDGTHHRYLFWDANDTPYEYDLSKGFCVRGEDSEGFLREKLTLLGLNEDEMNEFIVYWLPYLIQSPFNLISFQYDRYTENNKLFIDPVPDSELRVFMAFKPLALPVDIEPQQLEGFERKGFTVVEWGGEMVKD